MFNSFSRRQIVKVAVGFVAGIACIVQTQTIVQAKERIEERSEELLAPPKISLAGTYIIRSLGTTPGAGYLDGRTGNGTVGLAPDFTGGFSGTRWEIVDRDNYYTIRSCGTTPGADYLDGRTGDGTVGLAPDFTERFSGARWKIHAGNNGAIIKSLGTTPGAAYLDGRTGNGTVGLAPTYIEGQGFSGASWSIERTDEPCAGPG